MDARLVLLATLAILGSGSLAPLAAADVSVSLPVCDLEGHCTCVTPTVQTKLVEKEIDRCAFVG
jgi:hypothetical protein